MPAEVETPRAPVNAAPPEMTLDQYVAEMRVKSSRVAWLRSVEKIPAKAPREKWAELFLDLMNRGY